MEFRYRTSGPDDALETSNRHQGWVCSASRQATADIDTFPGVGCISEHSYSLPLAGEETEGPTPGLFRALASPVGRDGRNWMQAAGGLTGLQRLSGEVSAERWNDLHRQLVWNKEWDRDVRQDKAGDPVISNYFGRG